MGVAETSWLIGAPGPRYLEAVDIGHHARFRWTADPSKAVRFQTMAQADLVMMAVRELAPALFAFAVNLGDPQPVEHNWIEAASYLAERPG